jgi:transcriptional regulator with XRE-family HTH domain
MIGQRLREYRKNKGFKIKELANIIGFSQGGLSDIENEKADPSTQTLLKLVQNTDINLAWLLTGKGPMKWSGYPMSVAESVSCYGPEVDNISAKILALLEDMPEDDRRDILKSIEEKKLLRELIEERKKLKDTG